MFKIHDLVHYEAERDLCACYTRRMRNVPLRVAALAPAAAPVLEAAATATAVASTAAASAADEVISLHFTHLLIVF